MVSPEPSITGQSKWPFLRSTKLALISIIIWIIISLLSDNHYIQHFIPLFIGSLPRTDAFSFVLKSDRKDSASNFESIHFRPSLRFHEGVKIVEQIPNCGLDFQCPEKSFPITLSTGQDNQQFPQLCVDGKVILKKGINNCGRGINVAVIDNVTKTVTRVVNYDTYATESANLETMLLTLRRGEIVILITFDEPSTKLSTVARLLLHELGSSQAQNLQFRTSWYLITFKGLNGYSPYEEIDFPGSVGWGKSLSLNTCLPFSFEGQIIKPDKTVVDNALRLKFCENYGHYWPLFCASNLVNDPLVTSRIYHTSPISREILRTPIIVINRQCENKYFPLLLETILLQPELKPNKVMVAIQSNCHPSLIQLIRVFNFEIYETRMDHNGQYINIILDHAERFYRYAYQLIVIDDSVVLSPDFLPYMGQLLPLLHYPNSGINFISAWNENGFSDISNDASLVYRIDNLNYPIRLAFMIKRDTRLTNAHPEGALWSLRQFDSSGKQLIGDGIIPDQSRILPTRPITINGPVYDPNDNNQPYDGYQERVVSMEEEIPLSDVYSLLSKDNYGLKVTSLFNESDKYHSLEAFKSDAINKPKQKKITLICQNMDDCQKYCGHFGITHCSFQFDIPLLGSILRFTTEPDKQIILMKLKH